MDSMLTAVMIGGSGLDAEDVSRAQAACDGSEPVWLAPGVAAEFEFRGGAADLDPVRDELAQRRIDLAVLPSKGRRKRLLVADMDSTIIEQECIDELASEAGVGQRVAAITSRAMNGEIKFEDAVRERVGLLAGMSEAAIEKVWHERVAFTPGAAALVATMRAAGTHTVLISGGFTDFTGRVAERLGFHEHHANRLLREDGRLTGEVGRPILGRDAKRTLLLELLDRLNLEPDDAMAVGDGSNDVAMLKLAGCGVAFRAKPIVKRQSNTKLDFADLTGLLYLQGFKRSEFVDP